ECSQFTKSRVDFVVSQFPQPLTAKLFYVEGGHDRTVDYCAPDSRFVRGICGRQVSHEAAREAVTRAGGIEYFFKRISRRRKVRAFREHCRAILSALHH